MGRSPVSRDGRWTRIGDLLDAGRLWLNTKSNEETIPNILPKLDELDGRMNQGLSQAKGSNQAAIANARTRKSEQDKEWKQDHERACEVCVNVSRSWCSGIGTMRALAKELAKEVRERRRTENTDEEKQMKRTRASVRIVGTRKLLQSRNSLDSTKKMTSWRLMFAAL